MNFEEMMRPSDADRAKLEKDVEDLQADAEAGKQAAQKRGKKAFNNIQREAKASAPIIQQIVKQVVGDITKFSDPSLAFGCLGAMFLFIQDKVKTKSDLEILREFVVGTVNANCDELKKRL